MKQLELTATTTSLVKSSVMELLPYGAIGVQPSDGKILFANDFFFTLTGYTRQDLLSRESMSSYFDLIYFADREIIACESSKQLARQGRIELECRLVKKDGSFVWIKLYGGFMRDIVEGLYLQYIFLDNIMDKKIIEKQLKISEDHYRIICEQAQKILVLTEKAQKDLLTGLLNKITTQEQIDTHLNQHHEQQMFHALYLIDIDNFKNINDHLGHLQGDSVLIEIAECLRRQCSENDIIGRIGGDEFIVFINNTSSKKAIRQKAKELATSFRQFFHEQKKNYKISASIGIAIYPANGRTFQELYEKADTALYLSKKKGKDYFSFFADQ